MSDKTPETGSEAAALSSGLGYTVQAALAAHAGRDSFPIEAWTVQGVLTVEGPPGGQQVGIGLSYFHVNPVLFDFVAVSFLASHVSVTDLRLGVCYSQEQVIGLTPFASVATDHLAFSMPYGVGGRFRRPVTFLQSLARLGSAVWIERFNTAITTDVPLPRGGNLRLELIPESGPVWWRVDLGANYQAETVSYPRCQARGRLRLPSLDAAVSGSLSLEQVGSARSLRDAYRNLLSMRLSLPGGYRLALYSLSDHRGLRVLPQAFLVYPDGRLHTAHDVVIRVQDVWKSAVTRRYYGSKWSVESQALDLRAEVWTPTSAQEVPGLFGVRPYYFGAVRVEGRHRGQDFADVGMVAQEYRNQDALLLALSGR